MTRLHVQDNGLDSVPMGTLVLKANQILRVTHAKHVQLGMGHWAVSAIQIIRLLDSNVMCMVDCFRCKKISDSFMVDDTYNTGIKS